jgi:hypothetical protein
VETRYQILLCLAAAVVGFAAVVTAAAVVGFVAVMAAAVGFVAAAATSSLINSS